jgi:hypothetical protein
MKPRHAQLISPSRLDAQKRFEHGKKIKTLLLFLEGWGTLVHF